MQLYVRKKIETDFNIENVLIHGGLDNTEQCNVSGNYLNTIYLQILQNNTSLFTMPLIVVGIFPQ